MICINQGKQERVFKDRFTRGSLTNLIVEQIVGTYKQSDL